MLFVMTVHTFQMLINSPTGLLSLKMLSLVPISQLLLFLVGSLAELEMQVVDTCVFVQRMRSSYDRTSVAVFYLASFQKLILIEL